MAVSVAGLLLVTGCSGDDDGSTIEPIGADDDQGVTAPSDDEVDAAEPDEPDDEVDAAEPDEPDDPFAVPDEIDIAYAQRVLDELFRIEAEVYNDVLETGVPDDGLIPLEQLEPLRDISASPETFQRLSGALERAASNEFDGIEQPVPPRAFEVGELPRATEDCIFAEGVIDLTVTAVDSEVEMVAHQFSLVPDDGNGTGWAIWAYTAVNDDFEGFDPEEGCP